MSDSTNSSNNPRYNQKYRPQTSYYPAPHHPWRFPHDPNLHWNSHFHHQQHEETEQPVENRNLMFQQSPSPSLLPPSQNSQDQFFHSNRPNDSPIEQSNNRERYYHPFHHLENHLPNRRWFNTDYQQYIRNHQHQYFQLHLICYNILAQTLLENNPSLYVNCFRNNLKWFKRKERLLRELLRQDADIICLQEMQNDHYEIDFRPSLMQQGYESIYIQRTGDKSDGCCLFYKTNRLRLVQSKAVPFYQSNIQLLDRDNCGLIALFQPLTPNATSEDLFCVATTHLLFSPKRGDIKLAQVQYFLAEIDRLATKDASLNSYYPIILCGDLNAQPQSPLYQFLINGYIKYNNYRSIEISGQLPSSIVNNSFSHQLPSNALLPSSFVTADCRLIPTQKISTIDTDEFVVQTVIDRKSSAILTHDKKFLSVYDSNDFSEVTSHINHESNLVDYILYTKQDNDVDRLNLLSRYDLYKQNQMINIYLPNHQFASDHFLLAAKFALKLRKKNN